MRANPSLNSHSVTPNTVRGHTSEPLTKDRQSNARYGGKKGRLKKGGMGKFTCIKIADFFTAKIP